MLEQARDKRKLFELLHILVASVASSWAYGFCGKLLASCWACWTYIRMLEKT